LGIVDRLQALDDRYIPWAKPRAPETPPEWTPEIGPLVSVKKLVEAIAWCSVGFGLLATAVELVSASPLAAVVGTLVTAGIFGLIMSLFARGMLEAGLGLAHPVSASIPVTRPSSVFKRNWPWLVVLGAVYLGLALGSTTPGGIAMGTAIWQYWQAWWLGRWQNDHNVEVLVATHGWRKRRGFYLRPAPFSGRSLPESVRKPPQN